MSPTIDPLDKPIKGAKAIAAFIEEPLTRTKYMLAKGQIDATKFGKLWITTPRRLVSTFASRAERGGQRG